MIGLAQQYNLDDIKIQEPTENQWSSPIDWNFGVLRAKSQISLTNVVNTSDEPVNVSTYNDLTRTDLHWLAQKQGLKLATHPLYFEISEGRDNKTKDAYNSVKSNYFVTGSGTEYFGDNIIILGIDPIVLDRKKGIMRYTHTALAPRMNSHGNTQNFLGENSWFSKQGRELKYPIDLFESNEDGPKIVDVNFRSYGYVGLEARGLPLYRGFYRDVRLMKNLEMELDKNKKIDKRILGKAKKIENFYN